MELQELISEIQSAKLSDEELRQLLGFVKSLIKPEKPRRDTVSLNNTKLDYDPNLS